MARSFKNIEGVSVFHDSKTCYINRKGKSLKLNNCNVVEVRNVDLSFERIMPSTSLMTFKKPVTCHHVASDKFLFCGTYRIKRK